MTVVILCGLSSIVLAQKLKPEEIVAKHLDSIGKPEIRNLIKTQIAVGRVTFKSISVKNLTTEGRVVMASADNKNFFGLNMNAPDYPMEKFVYDGKDSNVALIRTGGRSTLGNFINSNSLILEGSLFGGVLSTSWSLLDLKRNDAKISSDGTKKIDGREVYILSYSPKKGSDVDVTIYFDKETFRHIRTEYKRIASAGIGLRPEQSSGFNESRFKLVEKFSDFREEKGLMLPHNFQLEYSVTGQNGTTELEWVFNLNEFAINQILDPNTFKFNANQ